MRHLALPWKSSKVVTNRSGQLTRTAYCDKPRRLNPLNVEADIMTRCPTHRSDFSPSKYPLEGDHSPCTVKLTCLARKVVDIKFNSSPACRGWPLKINGIVMERRASFQKKIYILFSIRKDVRRYDKYRLSFTSRYNKPGLHLKSLIPELACVTVTQHLPKHHPSMNQHQKHHSQESNPNQYDRRSECIIRLLTFSSF